jgi:hypothetical protein
VTYQREFADTPFGRMSVWHPVLDSKKGAYGRPFEVTDQHQLAAIVREHVKPVDGQVVDHEWGLMLHWPTSIELYVYEGVLIINGVECGPLENARWEAVIPVRVTERVVLAFAPASNDRS